jgi:nanoRNase/pAp phosphatase (c-di-AMP/oligoRNAs hydrolase)
LSRLLFHQNDLRRWTIIDHHPPEENIPFPPLILHYTPSSEILALWFRLLNVAAEEQWVASHGARRHIGLNVELA